jgi:hypothetical protein
LSPNDLRRHWAGKLLNWHSPCIKEFGSHSKNFRIHKGTR